MGEIRGLLIFPEVCILPYVLINFITMETYSLAFSTGYSQFYICDKNSPAATGSDTFWTDEAFSSRIAIEEGILGVGTECYGPVKGELIVLEGENTNFNESEFDHIVEAGLVVNSGYIQVQNCPDSEVELEITVNPGSYRVRVYSSNLASVDGDEGDDFYRIEIWQDANLERRVIKKYHL